MDEQVSLITWIPIKDQLPDKYNLYLVHGPCASLGCNRTTVAWYNPQHGWSQIPSYRLDYITHWMPLPQPPQ